MTFKEYIEKYASAVIRLPKSISIPSNINSLLEQQPLLRRAFRRLTRDLALLITLQLSLLRKTIPTKPSRVLYVYLGTPQLGDSIMDLSPRVLWAHNKNIKVDMFSHARIAEFYQDDPSFNRIICNSRDLVFDYDFVVLQSYSWRCIKFKWRFYFFKPFLSIHGHYYGCEFNRLEFSDSAWRAALCIPLSGRHEITSPVFNLSIDHTPQPRTANRIALAVGGVVTWRTYSHWISVIKLLESTHPELEWILYGSSNGKKIGDDLLECSKHNNINNNVDLLSLAQVFEQLKYVTLLVAADGGLLHIGRAAKVPMVALFAGAIHPRMRFAYTEAAHVIHTEKQVSDIDPRFVAEAIHEHLRQPMKTLSCRFLGAEPECTNTGCESSVSDKA